MRVLGRYILSVVFIVQMYLAMLVLAIYWTPPTLWQRANAYRAVRCYCRYVRWSAAKIIGLRSEVRGQVPQGEVLIAAKHQSFFDVILIVSEVPRPKFIMKSSLRFAPILGWFALQIGCVPVDRGKRAEAIRRMVRDVKSGVAQAGQLIIYPQGTRVAPGAMEKYKVGTAVLYDETDQPCVPAATNVGVFWPRHGLYREPGLAVVEFLPEIPAKAKTGLTNEVFMAQLEEVIETASDRLMAEAGFIPP